MVFARATLSSFNIQFCSFGNLRQNRPLSFVSRIILSLVEVLFFLTPRNNPSRPENAYHQRRYR